MSTLMKDFTMLGEAHHGTVFEDYEAQRSAKFADSLTSIIAQLRHHHPEMTISTNLWANLLGYAAAGYATAELDVSEDSCIRIRGYSVPQSKDDPGQLLDSFTFVRYKYSWKGLNFILYQVVFTYYFYQFLLFPPDSDETVLSNSKATDALLLAIGGAMYPYSTEYIYLFNGSSWYASPQLYQEVQKTSWKDVILDEDMKLTLTDVIGEFFDNEDKYRDLGVPWKRGLIFYGPPGNGKTLSLRALMHSLSERPKAPTLLYVKSIANVYAITSIFAFARARAPCLLILEDIDTLVARGYQSYFFNEVDGLENNDGVMMIATTNHLDQLDEGLANRPSRFDRKYNFPVPDFDERVLYAEYWREKLKTKPVDFPKGLSTKIAKITEDFSFAYMKEAFVASLLALARADSDKPKQPKVQHISFADLKLGHDFNPPIGAFPSDKKGDDDFDDLPLWKEIQEEVKILRRDMGSKQLSDRVFSTTSMPVEAAMTPTEKRRMERVAKQGGVVNQLKEIFGPNEGNHVECVPAPMAPIVVKAGEKSGTAAL